MVVLIYKLLLIVICVILFKIMCLAMEAVPSILVDLIMSMTSSVKGVIGMSILEQGSSKQIN